MQANLSRSFVRASTNSSVKSLYTSGMSLAQYGELQKTLFAWLSLLVLCSAGFTVCFFWSSSRAWNEHYQDCFHLQNNHSSRDRIKCWFFIRSKILFLINLLWERALLCKQLPPQLQNDFVGNEMLPRFTHNELIATRKAHYTSAFYCSSTCAPQTVSKGIVTIQPLSQR